MLKMYRRGLTAVLVAGLSMAAVVSTSCGTDPEATLGSTTETATDGLANACNLDGTWAVKFVVPVSWRANVAVQGGQGEIVQWALSQRKRESDSTVIDSLKPCGSTVPDYKSQTIFGGETYGIRFPNSLFDGSALKATNVRTRVASFAVGSAFESDLAPIQIGVSLPNPLTDAWPTKAQELLSHVLDADGNGKPGVTLDAATGNGYAVPPVNFGRSKHADHFYVAIRNIAGMQGKITSCDRIDGNAVIPQVAGKVALNSRVLGCHKTDGSDCSPAEAGLLDKFQPDYQVASQPTATLVRMAAGATCAQVRAMQF
ncbi:MAG TPA: hypothetical protein VFH51_00275 [Myxococcota bacterium]|nr:hypothetical protein [Myxococcota bacterium]